MSPPRPLAHAAGRGRCCRPGTGGGGGQSRSRGAPRPPLPRHGSARLGTARYGSVQLGTARYSTAPPPQLRPLPEVPLRCAGTAGMPSVFPASPAPGPLSKGDEIFLPIHASAPENQLHREVRLRIGGCKAPFAFPLKNLGQNLVLPALLGMQAWSVN